MSRNEQPDRSQPVSDIKRHNAASLRVYLTDGSEKTVAITKSRQKWAQLATTLDAMPWDRIDCLDAKGAVLGVIESDEDFDLDDENELPNGDAKLAKVMAGLVKFTLTETRKMFQVQIDGFAKVLEAQAEAMTNLQHTYEMAAKVQMATDAVGATGGDTAQMMEMLKMAMMMSSMKQPKPMAQPPAQQRLPQVNMKPPAKPAGEGHP